MNRYRQAIIDFICSMDGRSGAIRKDPKCDADEDFEDLLSIDCVGGVEVRVDDEALVGRQNAVFDQSAGSSNVLRSTKRRLYCRRRMTFVENIDDSEHDAGMLIFDTKRGCTPALQCHYGFYTVVQPPTCDFRS